MAYQVLVTDLEGVTRQVVTEYESIALTRRLGGYSELGVTLDVREAAAAEVLIAERALLLYDGATPRFYGQVWEPLELNEANVVATARDPYAGLGSRRVRAAATYTAQDAGAIVLARLAVQNGYRDTFLVGNVQAPSASRTIAYDPGKAEDEVIDELAAMSDGFFYRVDPLVGTPGKLGTLQLLYPDAGTTRANVAFGYGPETVGNLTGFKVTRLLPLTRMTTSSQSSTGGRIAAAAEDTAATAEFGLFEDELAYTDVSDTALLQAAADAGVRPTPPLTIELTANVDAPLLFEDFDVGDFVRLHIEWGAVSMFEWVRVTEATLSIDKQGIPRLTSVIVETLSGARPNVDPARLFRLQLDGTRSRVEALERRVQEMNIASVAAPPAAPSSSGGDGGSTAPPVDTTPPPPPPPAPPDPPTISVSASGVNYRAGGVLHRGVQVNVSVDSKGLTVAVRVSAGGTNAFLGGSGSVFIDTGSGAQSVDAVVSTSAGSAEATTSATVPAVTSE